MHGWRKGVVQSQRTLAPAFPSREPQTSCLPSTSSGFLIHQTETVVGSLLLSSMAEVDWVLLREAEAQEGWPW